MKICILCVSIICVLFFFFSHFLSPADSRRVSQWNGNTVAFFSRRMPLTFNECFYPSIHASISFFPLYSIRRENENVGEEKREKAKSCLVFQYSSSVRRHHQLSESLFSFCLSVYIIALMLCLMILMMLMRWNCFWLPLLYFSSQNPLLFSW